SITKNTQKKFRNVLAERKAERTAVVSLQWAGVLGLGISRKNVLGGSWGSFCVVLPGGCSALTQHHPLLRIVLRSWRKISTLLWNHFTQNPRSPTETWCYSFAPSTRRTMP